MRDLVCISHLRWDFVWQRPQQLLSRLAKHHRVFFVEEPIASEDASSPHLDIQNWRGKRGEQVTVIRLIQPVDKGRWIGHGDPLTAYTYSERLNAFLQHRGVRAPLLWLYTPMASDFVDTLRPTLTIYDVMDQLSAFKGAPIELRERDKSVLRRADLVFTGGVSLFRDKQAYNGSTYLFPSGVDIPHFAQAAVPHKLPRPDDLAHVDGPILGYYGVIDERMDLALIDHLAKARPDAHILMLGPIVKISQDDLPRAANIHYLGMKTYEQLPLYLAHFDVALVPFALNEATRFLSPTKTLEYMAAHKPIVSTPIHDVIELYGSVVRIGETPEAFCEQVGHALAQTADESHRQKEDAILTQYSWDSIASQMHRLIGQRLPMPATTKTAATYATSTRS